MAFLFYFVLRDNEHTLFQRIKFQAISAQFFRKRNVFPKYFGGCATAPFPHWLVTALTTALFTTEQSHL